MGMGPITSLGRVLSSRGFLLGPAPSDPQRRGVRHLPRDGPTDCTLLRQLLRDFGVHSYIVPVDQTAWEDSLGGAPSPPIC